MKRTALVLSSGGARGFAHIGAIEALEESEHNITSIAGCSMGALIGGMYAAGQLPRVKEWIFNLDIKQVLALVDISFSLNHLVKGDKVMDALQKIVPDVLIEDLPIPYCAVAADLNTGQEIVFRKGSLYEAIRASISIPSFLRPQKNGRNILIDGGVLNALPLNRIKRFAGDKLIAVNVSAPNNTEWDEVRKTAYKRMMDEGHPILKHILPDSISTDNNYFSLLTRTVRLMIQQNTSLQIQLTPPDLLIEIPMNRFGAFEFDRGERIAAAGREITKEALQRWEQI